MALLVVSEFLVAVAVGLSAVVAVTDFDSHVSRNIFQRFVLLILIDYDSVDTFLQVDKLWTRTGQ